MLCTWQSEGPGSCCLNLRQCFAPQACHSHVLASPHSLSFPTFTSHFSWKRTYACSTSTHQVIHSLSLQTHHVTNFSSINFSKCNKIANQKSIASHQQASKPIKAANDDQNYASYVFSGHDLRDHLKTSLESLRQSSYSQVHHFSYGSCYGDGTSRELLYCCVAAPAPDLALKHT